MNARDPTPAEEVRFPWWIVTGAAFLALAYIPTLSAPFDFIDDGDLVYPAPPGTTLREHANLWWSRVTANVEHLGPFRPALWAHWHLQANVFGGEPLAWRVSRFVWCVLSAAMLLWLLRELRIPPLAAVLAGAAAMWNPYRNEVWMSLTLSEGVAMPYALFALVAARKGAHSRRAVWWDAAGVACVLFALGCKNTFAAIVPAQIMLRMWPEGVTLREAWGNRRRVVFFALPALLPVGHFVYFKLNWHPGQYDASGPSAAQFVRYLVCLKGAAGLDFLGIGVVMAGLGVWFRRAHKSEPGALATGSRKPVADAPGSDFACSRPFLCALLLLLAGMVVYLPVTIISGRYAMPAVWGLDILFALLLAALVKLPASVPRNVAWAAVYVGLVAVLLVNVHRQERAATRSRMLWDVAHHIERIAPPGATVAWISGEPSCGGLGVEEGIHLQWHLAHRGRSDVRIALLDSDEQPIPRAELLPVPDEPLLSIAGSGPAARRAWEPDRSFSVVYQFGRKRYDCHVSRRQPPLGFADAGASRGLPPTSP